MAVPNSQHRLIVGSTIDPVWLRFLQGLDGSAATHAVAIRAIATALGSPDGTVANIPPLSGSAVTILQGAGIAVTRDDAGAYAIALRPLGDSGAGTFKLITRDSTGRISGSLDGTAADVPYDNTTSGLTAEDSQTAIDELSAEKLDDAPSDGQEYIRKNAAWAVASGGGSGTASRYDPPAFSDVSALLHCNGANGSTTFTDQIGNVWTPNNATISTAQSVFGGASALFTGTSNSSIITPTSSLFDVGAGDWSFEFRIYPNGAHQTSARIFQTRDGDFVGGISLTLNNAGVNNNLGLYLSSNGTSQNILAVNNVGAVSASTFNAVIVSRRRQNIEVSIEGGITYQTAIAPTASLYYNAADSVIIGGNATGTSRSINAYLDEIRFTKGHSVIAAEIPNQLTVFPDS